MNIVKLALMLEAGRLNYAQKMRSIFGDVLYRYYPAWDASGTAAQDISTTAETGTYAGGVTLGATGIGDNKTAATLDGTGRLGVFSAAFSAGMPLTELTISVWVKIAAAQWADSTQRYMCNFRADTNNRMSIEKSTTANTLIFRYLAGATSKVVTASNVTSEDWMHLALTVSKSNDRLRGYINGSKIGADITGLGTWVGAIVTPYAAFGSDRTTAGSHIGGIAHGMILTREASGAEVAFLAGVRSTPGIVTFGDSKTASAAPGIQALIAAMRTATGDGWHEAARLAIGGTDTPDWVARIDADLAAIDATTAGRVKFVLYNLGANDNNDAPVYATYYADTLYCVQALHTKFPAAQIYLAKIWERGDQTWITTVQYAVVDALAAAYSYVHVGIDERLTLEAGDDGATWTSDGTHPTNPAGYVREWADPSIGWLSCL